MSDLTKDFRELYEQAKITFDKEQNIMQVLVIGTEENKIYTFANHGTDIEELQFISLLQKNGDVKIAKLLCLWSSLELDVPSMYFRTLLIKLHPENKIAKLILQGEEGYIIKELGMLV